MRQLEIKNIGEESITIQAGNPTGTAISLPVGQWVTLEEVTALRRELAEAKEHAQIRTDYINRLLDKIVALEKECGRDPGDY